MTKIIESIIYEIYNFVILLHIIHLDRILDIYQNIYVKVVWIDFNYLF